MIKLQRIKTADVDLYQFMENLITTAFPAEEYRALEQLREYTDKVELFHNNVILEDEHPIGLLTYWNFGEFYYIEHFATDPSMRNGGYGKKTLEYVCTQLGKPIVLEVERPEEEMAIRRIGFYQRQGFKLWKNDYLQPPYKEGDDFLPLYIMAHGDLNPDTDYETVKNKIHRFVYGVKE